MSSILPSAEQGPSALVQLPEPVNKFPELVGYVVKRLRTLCPTLGKKKIAQTLARAGPAQPDRGMDARQPSQTANSRASPVSTGSCAGPKHFMISPGLLVPPELA